MGNPALLGIFIVSSLCLSLSLSVSVSLSLFLSLSCSVSLFLSLSLSLSICIQISLPDCFLQFNVKGLFFHILIWQPCFIWQCCLQRHKILNIFWGQALLLYRLYNKFGQVAQPGPHINMNFTFVRPICLGLTDQFFHVPCRFPEIQPVWWTL